MTARAELAVAHLLLRLRALQAPLRAAVSARQALSDTIYPPGAATLFVTSEQVERILDAVVAPPDAVPEATATCAPGSAPAAAHAAHAAAERDLRARAARAGCSLPLDALATEHHLDAFERDVLTLCVAPELDRAYERVYGFIVDDLARGAASVELCCAVGAPALGERIGRRRALAPLGRLRRTGLVEARGDAASDLRQELRLAPFVLDLLLGGAAELSGVLGDPAEVVAHAPDEGAPGAAVALTLELEAAAAALARGGVDLITISGGHPLERRAAALALATRAGLPLRRLDDPAPAAVRAALLAAAATGAILWAPADLLGGADEAAPGVLAALEELLARSRVPLCLTAPRPWRPLALLATRRLLALSLPPPPLIARERLWAEHFPGLAEPARRDLAARFHVGALELGAAARLVETERAIEGIALAPGGLAERAAAAVRSVAHASGGRYAHAVVPRRVPDDLILEPGLHQQVLEVAHFHRLWPRVAEGWGFGRLVTGGGGVKALFTGDSGTGKTLAAEVIAAVLGQTLLRVDLAHVVSKWVGETEKNLDEAFRQAERGQAVLFFDEAEALFGKRAEVRQGSDRYANLEVSYLLQRLEDHGGLVILASNLREQLDPAFTRRFQVVLHFPRPSEAERRRLWRLAFPAGAPLAPDLSLEALAGFELTGAAIVSSARTAGLIAMTDGRAAIAAADVREAIRRELQREGRFMPVLEPAAPVRAGGAVRSA